MRIHLIAPGGIARGGENADVPALCALVERFARKHEVLAVLLRQYPALCHYERLGAQILNLGQAPRGLGRIEGQVRRLRLGRWLRGAPAPDIVHAIWIGAPSELALRHPTAGRAPRVVTTFGGELVSLERIQYGGLLTAHGRRSAARVFESADAVLACCEESLARVPQGDGQRRLLPIFPDTAPFLRAPGSDAGQPGHILTVSNINRVKDPGTLLRAFALAAQAFPEARLTWCGLDTLGGEAQRLAAELGIAEHVTFTGLLRYEALPAQYHAAQIYLQASLHEGQGVAVCEAAAAGLAIVGSEVGILRDLAAEGGAVSAPTGDVEALAAALRSVLGDATWRAELSERGRAWAAERTAEHTAAALEELYQELLARC